MCIRDSYYTALIGYIWYEAPEDEKNFTTLLEMINASEAREDDEDFQNPVDLMFERVKERDLEHFAVKHYKKYKLAAGKTAKSILISCGARLAPVSYTHLSLSSRMISSRRSSDVLTVIIAMLPPPFRQ